MIDVDVPVILLTYILLPTQDRCNINEPLQLLLSGALIVNSKTNPDSGLYAIRWHDRTFQEMDIAGHYPFVTIKWIANHPMANFYFQSVGVPVVMFEADLGQRWKVFIYLPPKCEIKFQQFKQL